MACMQKGIRACPEEVPDRYAGEAVPEVKEEEQGPTALKKQCRQIKKELHEAVEARKVRESS